jgi:hypothetical protein
MERAMECSNTYNFYIVSGRPSGMVPPILSLLRSLNEVANQEVLSANLKEYHELRTRWTDISNSTDNQLTR